MSDVLKCPVCDGDIGLCGGYHIDVPKKEVKVEVKEEVKVEVVEEKVEAPVTEPVAEEVVVEKVDSDPEVQKAPSPKKTKK